MPGLGGTPQSRCCEADNAALLMYALLLRPALTAGVPSRRGLPGPRTGHELPAHTDVVGAAFVEAAATDASAGAIEKATKNAGVCGSTALTKKGHLARLLGRETDRWSRLR